MAAGLRPGDRPSLGEASKRWRQKRRRAVAQAHADLAELHHPKPLRTPTLPLPWRGGPDLPFAGAANSTDVSHDLDSANLESCYSTCTSKKQRSLTMTDGRVRKNRDDKALGGAGNAVPFETKNSKRRRPFVSKIAVVEKSLRAIPKLALLPQEVSWSLLQGCRSSSSTKGGIGSISPIDARAQQPRSPGRGILRSPPRKSDVGGPGSCTGGDSDATINDDDDGINNNNNNNNNNYPHSKHGQGKITSSSSSSSIPVVGETGVDEGTHHASNNANHGCRDFVRSSWQLRRYFPPDALVPRAQPTCLFTSTATNAAFSSGAQISHVRGSALTKAAPSCVLPAAEVKRAIFASLRPSLAGSIGARPNTSMCNEPEVERPYKEHGRPHTVGAGLHGLGDSLTGTLVGGVQTPDKHCGGATGSFYAVVRRELAKFSGCAEARVAIAEERKHRAVQQGDGGASDGDSAKCQRRTQRGTHRGEVVGAAAAPAVARAVVGLTVEALASPGVAFDRSGRVKMVEKYMLAFDEVWPADLPALRPLRLNLRRSCGVPTVDTEVGHGEGLGGPVFLMPMHRRGKGVKGREDELFAEPPRLRRDEEEMAVNRDRYCFHDENGYGMMSRRDGNTGGHCDDGSGGRRKWARCKLAATGVGTWRWEWFSEAHMMLGKLALWSGALLISRTQAVLRVFGLGMAGRVVVEGAAYPRGLLVEAYVPASSETCELHISVEDVKLLFADDPDKMWVGNKANMVLELVKMLYFDYTLQTEEVDPSLPGGIRLRSFHYSDREPWTCLHTRRDADVDLHWERRRCSPGTGSTATAPVVGGKQPKPYEGTGVRTRSTGESSSAGTASPACANFKNNNISISSDARGVAVAADAGTFTMACVRDERAVWILQRLHIRNTQNLVDIDVEPREERAGGKFAAVEAAFSCPSKSRNVPALAAAAAARQGQGKQNTFDEGLSSATSRDRSGQRWNPTRVRKVSTVGRPKKAGAKKRFRVRAFDIRVEECKEERRHAEEANDAKLRAWFATKKRFRGLTLGTVIRVSGRMLMLMVHEFPDRPGILQTAFTIACSGAKFCLGVGMRAVAVSARHLSITSPPEIWTLGQKRRVIKAAIQKASALVLAEEEETGGRRNQVPARSSPTHPDEGPDNGVSEDLGSRRASQVRSVNSEWIEARRRGSVHSLVCAIRCLGRDSSATQAPAMPTAARGFALLPNVHQLQQPSPKDHRRYCSLVVRERTATVPGSDIAKTWSGEPPAPSSSHVDRKRVSRDKKDDSVSGETVLGTSASSHEVNRLGIANITPVSGEDLGAKARQDVAGGGGGADRGGGSFVPRFRFRPPRRESGRGRRLCGGIARVGGARGIFSLLRGNWAGAEHKFLLDWHQPREFRVPGQGPVEAHTTFTLELVVQDLELLVETSDVMAAAEKCSLRNGAIAAFGDAPPLDDDVNNFTDMTGTTQAARVAPPDLAFPSRGEEAKEVVSVSPSALADRHGETRARRGDSYALMTESEAWQKVVREVLRRCSWSCIRSSIAEDQTTAVDANYSHAASEPGNQLPLEKCIVSQESRTTPTGTPTEMGASQSQPGSLPFGVAATEVRLVVGTCIFRRVIKLRLVQAFAKLSAEVRRCAVCEAHEEVAGSGIPPMHLLVVVSHWHATLVVRCYDFVGGETRQAERPDPSKDSALISEFKNMKRLEREMQLQVMLEDLVVLDDREEDGDTGKACSSWSVKFVEAGASSIVVDAGEDLYHEKLEEQMAAAAAQVEERRGKAQRLQLAARDKGKRASAKRGKVEIKRQEAQAKSKERQTGETKAKVKGTNSKKGRKLGGGGTGGTTRRSAEEDDGDADSDHSSRSSGD